MEPRAFQSNLPFALSVFSPVTVGEVSLLAERHLLWPALSGISAVGELSHTPPLVESSHQHLPGARLSTLRKDWFIPAVFLSLHLTYCPPNFNSPIRLTSPPILKLLTPKGTLWTLTAEVPVSIGHS